MKRANVRCPRIPELTNSARLGRSMADARGVSIELGSLGSRIQKVHEVLEVHPNLVNPANLVNPVTRFTRQTVTLTSAFERGAIPLSEVSSGGVGRLEEREQRFVRTFRIANSIVGQDELAKVLTVERTVRADACLSESRRLRIRVGVERRVIDRRSSRPEAAARFFV